MVVENEARRGRSRASVACSRSATEESQFRHATDSDAHRGNCLLDWELGIQAPGNSPICSAAHSIFLTSKSALTLSAIALSGAADRAKRQRPCPDSIIMARDLEVMAEAVILTMKYSYGYGATSYTYCPHKRRYVQSSILTTIAFECANLKDDTVSNWFYIFCTTRKPAY